MIPLTQEYSTVSTPYLHLLEVDKAVVAVMQVKVFAISLLVREVHKICEGVRQATVVM